MRRAQWLSPDDPRVFRVMRELWKLTWELAGRFVPPRGVFKFRSIEEANAHRDACERERIQRIREKSAARRDACAPEESSKRETS